MIPEDLEGVFPISPISERKYVIVGRVLDKRSLQNFASRMEVKVNELFKEGYTVIRVDEELIRSIYQMDMRYRFRENDFSIANVNPSARIYKKSKDTYFIFGRGNRTIAKKMKKAGIIEKFEEIVEVPECFFPYAAQIYVDLNLKQSIRSFEFFIRKRIKKQRKMRK